MDPLPDRRRTPRESVTVAAKLYGRDTIVKWCEELLAARVLADDPAHPDIIWLRGSPGWPEYWGRVWGARGLLHIGPPSRPEVVMSALSDPAWRVREMALKVVATHRLPDPTGVVDPMVEDPVERVRIQAWRALGLGGEPQ